MVSHKLPKVTLVYSAPLALAEIGARVCYDSFELSENEDIKNFKVHQVVKGGTEDIESSELLDKLAWVHFHHSVLEHVTLSYYVEDVPRNVVIEWNRSRIGVSTSQKSSRYTIDVLINSFLSTFEVLKSTQLLNGSDFYLVVANNVSVTDPEVLDNIVKYLWDSLCILHKQEELIIDLKGGKKKYQNDRVKVILPEVWVMEGLWTFNLRSLKHFLDLRDSASAYYGIREVAKGIIDATPKKYLDLIRKKGSSYVTAGN